MIISHYADFDAARKALMPCSHVAAVAFDIATLHAAASPFSPRLLPPPLFLLYAAALPIAAAAFAMLLFHAMLIRLRRYLYFLLIASPPLYCR